jgi:predicted transcriptional regulator
LKIEDQIQSRNGSLSLTPLELDLMKVVWQQCPCTVKDVQLAIQSFRPLAYTTVMTVLHRLYLKGFLVRTLKSKAHYYQPTVAFADVRDAAVSGIIDDFFSGSRDEFMEFMGTNGGGEEPINAPPSALDETLL